MLLASDLFFLMMSVKKFLHSVAFDTSMPTSLIMMGLP